MADPCECNWVGCLECDSPERVAVELNAKEIQTVLAAMAGNHPDSLDRFRVRVIRRLTTAGLALSSATVRGDGGSNG